jgi:RNA polymerase sigma-70 factor (ECF subfamily)
MPSASRCCEIGSAQLELVQALVESRRELVNYLARRLACRATAEDIAQDVFVRLAGSKVAAVHPRHLIFRTAANLATNYNRDERRRAELRHLQFASEQADSDQCHPERIAIARDSLRRLALELSTWPARTREIFILNRYDGLTQREIGDRLVLSSTSIERHMARAVLRLAHWVELEGI